jgi:hypothetical protein
MDEKTQQAINEFKPFAPTVRESLKQLSECQDSKTQQQLTRQDLEAFEKLVHALYGE